MSTKDTTILVTVFVAVMLLWLLGVLVSGWQVHRCLTAVVIYVGWLVSEVIAVLFTLRCIP